MTPTKPDAVIPQRKAFHLLIAVFFVIASTINGANIALNLDYKNGNKEMDVEFADHQESNDQSPATDNEQHKLACEPSLQQLIRQYENLTVQLTQLAEANKGLGEELLQQRQYFNEQLQQLAQTDERMFQTWIQQNESFYSYLEQTELKFAELTQQSYGYFCSVGVKDRRIPDSAMTASSHWNDSYRAFYGRLDNTGELQAFWHPEGGKYNGAWLQVDLGLARRVTGVVTQGRPTLDHWTTSYKVLYGSLTSNLVSIQNQGSNEDEIFQGNRDRNSKVINMFPQPITARYFRLVAVTYSGAPVLRLDYLTC